MAGAAPREASERGDSQRCFLSLSTRLQFLLISTARGHGQARRGAVVEPEEHESRVGPGWGVGDHSQAPEATT